MGDASTVAIGGIHHVTAIAADPQRNLDFYAGALGLRLVKRTVNFDDPGTYHLYYGDGAGSPGSIITFFPYLGAHQGRHGVGQAAETRFAVPKASIGFWVERLMRHHVTADGPAPRFGDNAPVLGFRDPDGLMLELVGLDEPGGSAAGWDAAPVPAEHAIRRVLGVSLWLEAYERSAALLTGPMGFRAGTEEGERRRYLGAGGAEVELRCAPGFWPGAMGAGAVHLVAFRVPDLAAEEAARGVLAREAGLDVTPVLDRQYFRSVYFREPGGVLFELATDPPGFAADEPAEVLGESLKLPAWLEPRREAIERRLPELHPPQGRR
jgi:catechol 2,3-dioxygenase-like lactoylglutathione lyase family enzyme